MDNILIKLLILDGNETHYLKSYDSYKLFQNLVIEVAKAEKNIRFCSNSKCSCHPETSIKRLLKNEGLREFLNDWCKGVTEQLESWCEIYSPVVAKEIYDN